MTARPRVAIVGGGFAGLESAFTLRQRLGDRVDLTLISDSATFLFKPNAIHVPFGADARKSEIPIARPGLRRLIRFHHGTVAGINESRVELLDGSRVGYDFAVLATGAAMRPDEIPGLAEHAETVWTPEQLGRLGARLDALRTEALRGPRRVLFVVPPGTMCAGPLYEIAFMLDTWLRRHGIRDRVELGWTTYEDSYLQAFGPRPHELVAGEFARRGIDGHTGAVVSKVSADEVLYEDGSLREYDLLIAFPPYAAAVEYDRFPADERGFLRTDPASRLVEGTQNVYAPGDAGDFPAKQAFLALLQADATADHIAARIDPRLRTPVRDFEPASMYMPEMFSPLWRLRKKMLGLYLPWQFKAGRPFHGGSAGAAMDLALRGMSKAFATGEGALS